MHALSDMSTFLRTYPSGDVKLYTFITCIYSLALSYVHLPSCADSAQVLTCLEFTRVVHIARMVRRADIFAACAHAISRALPQLHRV